MACLRPRTSTLKLQFYSNVIITTSGSVPTRIGGPHVPTPQDVYTIIFWNRCSPYAYGPKIRSTIHFDGTNCP